MGQLAAGMAALGKSGNSNANNNSQNNNPVDLGYAVYNNGTPVGIMGVAPFAEKRGGRVNKCTGKRR